jgi:peptidoglycan/xylan/chitin deacetylase (PgdA/CDA1 family)
VGEPLVLAQNLRLEPPIRVQSGAGNLAAQNHMHSSRSVLLITALVISGCDGVAFAGKVATASPTSLPPIATSTAAPTATFTQPPPLAPSPTATPTWAAQGPGAIKVPILMYHHVEVAPIDSYLRVPAAKFDDEMRLLHDWEYKPITTTMLMQAITKGISLPPRPFIITFDDANEDTYSTAFPIMQKYGFTGVLYLPYDYIGTPGYMTVDQIKQMIAAGWEVGSHSLSHLPEPVMDPAQLRAEIVDSRKKLAALLGAPILTFAYPFGDVTPEAVDYVRFAGYMAAMDAKGFTADQGLGNLFALQREEIRASEDAKTFIRFLPWAGNPAFLPSDTPTPTPRPTRTPIPTYTQYPTRTQPSSPTP